MRIENNYAFRVLGDSRPILICDNCKEMFWGNETNSILLNEWGHFVGAECPKCKSVNTGIIDELIAPLIKWLNVKGYNTFCCCSGHASEIKKEIGYDFTNTYILFLANVKKNKEFFIWLNKNMDLVDKDISIDFGELFFKNPELCPRMDIRLKPNYMNNVKNKDVLDIDFINARLQALINFNNNVKFLFEKFEEIGQQT